MRRLLLVIAALFLIAPHCGPLPSTGALFYLDPHTLSVADGQLFSVDVVIQTGALTSVQAWELAISGTPLVAIPVSAEVHAEFDDDGQLFVTPEPDLTAGTLKRVVDLRHGASASGSFRVATIHGVASGPGVATLTITGGGLARPDGSEIPTIRGGTTITVTP